MFKAKNKHKKTTKKLKIYLNPVKSCLDFLNTTKSYI